MDERLRRLDGESIEEYQIRLSVMKLRRFRYIGMK